MRLNTTTIIEAMQDKQIFGRTFKRGLLRGDSWKAWRSFLAALFGLPLDPEALAVYQKHTGRQAPPAAAFLEAMVVAGRRSGKSIISALVATFLAAFRDYSQVLAPGETGTLMIIAENRKQSQVIFRYVCAFFETPMLQPLVAVQRKESLELTSGVVIEIHTCSFRATRGYTLIGAICDELAFWAAEDAASPDFEVLNSLRPGLATTNGLLLGISSPYAKRGVLYQGYRDHYGKDASPVLVWKASSREMNPTLSAATVATAYVRDPLSAAAEFGGEFRDDISGFITRELIDRVVIPGRQELAAIPGVRYYGFCDPSGGSSDSMTLAIAHIADDRAVLDLLREVRPPFSPESTAREFSALLKSYKISTVVGDAYGGQWPREQFRKFGRDYEVSEANRSEIYLTLLPAITSGQIELLDSQRLVQQLCGLERRTARGGRDSVDHAPGSHDDLCNAAAGALVQALKTCRTFGFFDFIRERAAAVRGEIVSEPATPQEAFDSQARAQMENAIASDARVATVFGAPKKNTLAASEVRSQAGVAAPSCCPQCPNEFLSSREDRFGNRRLACGSCGWSASIPPKIGQRFDGTVQNR